MVLEHREAALLDLTFDAILVRDFRSDRIEYWNHGAEEMYGFSRNEAVGRVSHDLLQTEHPVAIDRAKDVLVSTGRWEGELIHTRRDGTRIVVASRWALQSEDGEPVAILETNTDITDRARADAERLELLDRERGARALAEESRRRLAFLVDAGDVLASSLDYETTLASVAKLAVPAVGDWCAVHVVGEGGEVRQIAVMHRDPRAIDLVRELERRYPYDPNGTRGVPNVLRTGEPEFIADIDEEMLEAAGLDDDALQLVRDLGLRSSMVVPLVARERVLGAMTFVAAESGRRYGPDDVTLAQELARRAALAVENARLYREAQQVAAARSATLAQKDDFLTAVAHDLNTPLTSLKGTAQILRRRIEQGRLTEPEQLIEGLVRIEQNVTRMTSLINELLDLGRLQTGQGLDLNREQTDIVALIARCINAQRDGSVRDRVKVEAEVPELIGAWDADRIERVIANLLSNAIKYSPGGGPVIVEVREQVDGGRNAVISVHDNGIGIPQEDVPYIFERFRRGSNVGRDTMGTGIGLAGARQIVEQHGGTIEVESEEGVGSTFTVYLPAGGA